MSDDTRPVTPGTDEGAEAAAAQEPVAVQASVAAPIQAAPPPRRAEGGWRSGGIYFGALLVTVGVVALLGGFTSLFDLLRFWPLLIVLGGVTSMFDSRREVLVKRLAEGLGTVAIGLVLLGCTLGYIRWTVWLSLVSLWPLLLIALGVELVGRGLHMNWLRALSNVVLILGLVYGVFVLQYMPARAIFPFGSFAGPITAFSDSAPHDAGVTTGHATVKVGATGFTLVAGDALASISGQAPSSDQPKLGRTTDAGGSAAVTVSESGRGAVFIGGANGTLDLTLDRAVRWSELRLDVGAVSGSVDLRGLAVSRVVMNAGASDLTLTIGDLAGAVDVEVSGGAMSLTIRVPAKASCTVQATSGLSEVRVPSSFSRTGGIPVFGNSTFVSDATGAPAIKISLTSGVSDFRIETY